MKNIQWKKLNKKNKYWNKFKSQRKEAIQRGYLHEREKKQKMWQCINNQRKQKGV